MKRLKKWRDEQEASTHFCDRPTWDFPFIFNLELYAQPAPDARAANLAGRDATSDAFSASYFVKSSRLIRKLFYQRLSFLIAFICTIVLISLACGAGLAPLPPGSLPQPTQALPASTQLVVESSPPPTLIPAPPAIPETRRLTLEYPSKMRAGVEGDVVRLTLEVDDRGNLTPTAQIEGNVVTGETISIPNLYETHNVTAEARLDLAGMQVQPSEAIYEPLTAGKSVTFFWSIHPQEPGIYRGTVWLHLRFVDRLSREESRIAVSAQFIEIEAVDFFGLSVNLVRTSGVIGSVVGSVIGFPFLEDLLKFLFRRKQKK
jgi:hypothetical protein